MNDNCYNEIIILNDNDNYAVIVMLIMLYFTGFLWGKVVQGIQTIVQLLHSTV
jgi:hypothetical protein